MRSKQNHQYSGPNSKPFWARVRRLLPNEGAHREIYALGVALQNLEGFVLNALANAEQEPNPAKET